MGDESESESEIFFNMFDECEDNVERDKDTDGLLGAFSDDFFTEVCPEPRVTNPPSRVTNPPSKTKFSLFDDSSEDDDDDEEDLLSCDESKSKPKLVSCDSNVGNRHTMNSGHINRTKSLPAWTGPTPDDDEFCCICMDEKTEPKTLHKCSHSFCTDCIEASFKIRPVCPVCFAPYGVITGNMPEGHMSDYISQKLHLPGYESSNTITVHYTFSSGTQKDNHPHPGTRYEGTSRTAYLPNNAEGQKVLRLLKESFKRKLTFTIGRSRTTGCDNVVTWNDIHHKTCTHGGFENFGYPDVTYLQRVQEELAAVGVTEESLNHS